MTDPTHPAAPGAAPDLPAARTALEQAGAEKAGPERAAPTPAEPAGATPSHSPRSALAVFSALGFLLAFLALFFIWQRLDTLEQPPGADPARVDGLEAQLRTLQQRLVQLEQRPAPVPAPAPDLRPLESRIAALEQRPAAAPAPNPSELTAPLTGRLEALERRLAQEETQARELDARATRLGRLQAAAVALDSGQKLGEIAGAPAALARFANVAPPTQAALVLAFPEAARAAIAASRPAADGTSLGQRVWQRVGALITVREGEKVILGAPATAVLATTKERLDAGDLAGAVAALDGLDLAAAAAMADWRAQAQALLDARAALGALLAGLARG
ncbi:hypothetical protein [Limobrevibacterium gyesilva]|uniref:Inner membrane protein n=1 Tax=Limobrevibacterium gyesilva TaxID=2991712 RepID=A0AA42CDA3_9PROT|nr:hypothetical protein [Limobrevibacterium gyesilva]MCW3474603.1 hypothetical protein [Limobrevibacterium gyesilva]